MNVWVKLAFKELLNQRRFSLFFIVNLMLGLTGFLMLDSFKLSLHQYFADRSKDILTADISIHATHPFRDDELREVDAVLGTDREEARQTTFFHMGATETTSRLLHIVGISDRYPFYGNLVLAGQGQVSPKLSQDDLVANRSIWVAPELLTALGTETGEKLKIGNASYQIKDTVIEEPSSSFNTFGVAAKVYMDINQIEKTGLIKPGSTVRYYRFYKFKRPEDEDDWLQLYAKPLRYDSALIKAYG